MSMQHLDGCPGGGMAAWKGRVGAAMETCLGYGKAAPAAGAPGELSIPRCPVAQRFGEEWPTHRGKARERRWWA